MEQFIYRDENVSLDATGKRSVFIDGDEHFHLSRVLRIRTGEEVLVTNGAGKTLLCVVRSVGKDRTVCEVVREHDNLNSPRREFCIAVSLLKPVSKLETAVEKCTELGAAGFLLFKSERTETVRPRLDRLEGIVRSAVKQSLRCRIPVLTFVENLGEAAAKGRSYDEKIVLHEKSENMISSHLSRMDAESSVIAMIGPEGGFSEAEIAFLNGNGYRSLSLGKARLRSETAAITIASLLSVY